MNNIRFRFILRFLLSAFAAGVLSASVFAADDKPADKLPLVTIPTKLLPPGGISSANAVVAHPNGRRVYYGVTPSTDPQRLNLVVLSLDAEGQVAGKSRFYADSALPLPANASSRIISIVPDFKRRKLYLSHLVNNPAPNTEKRFITIYDLDENGDLIGAPRTYAGGPNQSVYSLALHPNGKVLYFVGWGGAAVYYYKLDAKGEPQGEVQEFFIGGQGKLQVNVSADGKKLYLGSWPDLLQVVSLDDGGIPVAGSTREFTAGKEREYLAFQYSPRAIFLARAVAGGYQLAIWKLDKEGYPQGEPQPRPDLAQNNFAVSPDGSRLWIESDAVFKDALSGKDVVWGLDLAAYPILPDGTLSTPVRYPTLDHESSYLMTVSEKGTPVLFNPWISLGFLGNRTKDYRLRVTLTKADEDSGPQRQGPIKEPMKTTLEIAGLPVPLQLALGVPSEWIDLNPFLRDRTYPVFSNVKGIATLGRMAVKIEVAYPTEKGEATKVLTDEVLGDTIYFLLPSYGLTAAERETSLETFTDHALKYVNTARAAGLKPEERPRLFTIACSHLMGGQASMELLKREAEAVSLLGFNTVNCYNWGYLDPKKIDGVLDSYGLQRRSLAAYTPPSYFAFEQDVMNREALDKWATGVIKAVNASGGTPADVVDFKLADEPGWYYPQMLKELMSSPEYLGRYRDYLKSKGLTPTDVGKADWKDVMPIGVSGAKDLPSRKLYFHTMRFFTESATEGMKLAREAIERALGRPVSADVNWNNFGGAWYRPAPGLALTAEGIPTTDEAMGSMDWLAAGRAGAHTIWTEDWFRDQESQTWSVYGDMLRSSAMMGDQQIGGYVVGSTLGTHPAGASYKMLALAGHGGKIIDVFSFGPEYLFRGNCWSENFQAYKPMADAFRRIGRAERVLFPGKPARGNVAILIPSTSVVWDNKQSPYYYQEIYGLHYALVHSGYTVDFVDDVDLAAGALAERKYTTLFITGPNLARGAQEKLRDWISGGGTLVAMPGAAVADEYNTPTTLLDEALGVQGRSAHREAGMIVNENLPQTALLSTTDARFAARELPLYGPIEAINKTTAGVLATFKSEGEKRTGAAITANTFGKGRAIVYGFYPGWQYWASANRRNPTRLPLDWGADQRRLVVAPAQIAKTPRPVTLSQDGIEACRLQSDKGIAIVLLNWTDKPILQLTVTIPRVGKFVKVSSVEGVALKSQIEGDSIKVTLPIKNVDVLMLE